LHGFASRSDGAPPSGGGAVHFTLRRVLRHLAQATILAPSGKVADCKFGCCFRLVVGLNLVARRRTLFHAIIPFFSQSWQVLDIEDLFNRAIARSFDRGIASKNDYFIDEPIIRYFLTIGKSGAGW